MKNADDIPPLTAGVLVRSVPIPNNGGKAYRIYDIPTRTRSDDARVVISARVVDKLFHDEFALLLQVDPAAGKSLILTRRGISGWIGTCSIVPIE